MTTSTSSLNLLPPPQCLMKHIQKHSDAPPLAKQHCLTSAGVKTWSPRRKPLRTHDDTPPNRQMRKTALAQKHRLTRTVMMTRSPRTHSDAPPNRQMRQGPLAHPSCNTRTVMMTRSARRRPKIPLVTQHCRMKPEMTARHPPAHQTDATCMDTIL